MGFFDILGAFVPLIIVVALLYGVLVLVKKYGYNMRGKEYAAIDIKVVSTKMIMPKKFVSVIKVEDKLLVVGICDGSINLLKELDEVEIKQVPVEPRQNVMPGGIAGIIDTFKKNLGMR
jgi:flagellar protein FliO/FliZ